MDPEPVGLGRGNGYFHNCGQIGVAASPEEAVAKYGRVTWSPEGVRIGAAYFLKRSVFEAHR